MSLSRASQLAIRTLTRHRLRACFMMLGVTIGVATLTALASLGESTKEETMRRFKRMIGTFDTVIVRPGAGRTRGMPSLTTVEPSLKFEDAKAIASDIANVRRVAEVQNAFDIDVKYRDKTTSPAVFGVSSNWTALRDDDVADGRGISDEDVRSLARVAVLGADVKATLFTDENPIGRTVRIADVPFQIVGILASRGAGPGGGSLDNLLLIPVSTASKRLFNRDFLTMVIAQLKDPGQGDQTVTAITTLLRERHRLAATAQDDFTITNPRAAMARVTEVGSTLSKVLTGVGVLATLVGGVVIMSLMLMAVSERRKEIGVRRSVGATKRDVLVQFLIEAATVSTMGGVFGIGCGVGGTTVATMVQKLPPTLAWKAIAGAALMSVTLGVVFGLHPAWKASNVDPIAALRS
ncbi:MAG TPA: ABC transporter permease [Vicinamibacterales bacterium]|nr:ABC transporter permease [Vicinamibacterales bacterium]